MSNRRPPADLAVATRRTGPDTDFAFVVPKHVLTLAPGLLGQLMNAITKADHPYHDLTIRKSVHPTSGNTTLAFRLPGTAPEVVHGLLGDMARVLQSLGLTPAAPSAAPITRASRHLKEELAKFGPGPGAKQLLLEARVPSRVGGTAGTPSRRGIDGSTTTSTVDPGGPHQPRGARLPDGISA